MLSSLNLIQDVQHILKKYQNDLAPTFTNFSLSSLRPPIFTDYIPFKGEGFKDNSENILNEPETPEESFLIVFFKTLASVIFIGAYVLIVLFIAMIVANDMITLPVPLRILGFMVTVLLGIFPPALTVFIGYYVICALYAASMNFILDSSNPNPRPYLPRIFAILPISTAKFESNVLRFLTYPFTFPKSDKSEVKLVGITKDYIEDMKKSFSDVSQYVSSFSAAGDIMKRALLSIINSNRNKPVKSVQEFMSMPTSIPEVSAETATAAAAPGTTTAAATINTPQTIAA